MGQEDGQAWHQQQAPVAAEVAVGTQSHAEPDAAEQGRSVKEMAFAKAYFDLEKGKYPKDYDKLLTENLPSTYHVQDTWENYDLIKPQIDKRFAAWKKKRKTG